MPASSRARAGRISTAGTVFRPALERRPEILRSGHTHGECAPAEQISSLDERADYTVLFRPGPAGIPKRRFFARESPPADWNLEKEGGFDSILLSAGFPERLQESRAQGPEHDTISCMMKNINLSNSDRWPIRQVILGIVLFASGIAVGYTARDLPAVIGASGGPAGGNGRDDPSWGPANAKVTMVEFGDFECSYCRQWYATVYGQLYANYSGKIRFVFRDFPLSFNPNAQPAAIAADCAGAQGRYWDYFQLLYGDPRGLGSVMYNTYAEELGLNLSAFTSCIASNKYANEIDLDMQDGQRVGVNGVPAFFINDRLISGLQPYETFRQVIEEELNK
jgi:hypothetical protein